MRFLFLLLCMLLPVCEATHAQEYSYTHYDTRNGLPGSTVYCIAQSQDGFIWLGTEAGLCRFDGVNFKTYTIADGLPANDILNVRIDSRGRIWLISFKAAICYYENGKVHNQQNDPTLKKIELQDIPNCIAESDKGDIIIEELRHTYVITGDNQVKSYPAGADFLGQRSLLPAFRIISGNNSLISEFVRLPEAISRQINGNCYYYTSTSSINGKQYYFFNDGYRIWSFDGQKAWSAPLPHKLSYVVFLDSMQTFIYHYGKGVDLFHSIPFKDPVRYFPDQFINHVKLDQEQNLWFATKGAGVFKISANRFRNLFAADEKGATYVRSIHKVGDHIYIAGLHNRYWRTQPVNERFFHNDSGARAESFRADHAFLGRIPAGTLIHNSTSDFLNLTRFHNDSISYCKTIQVLGDTVLVAGHHGCFLFNWKKARVTRALLPDRTSCAYRLGNDYYIGTLNGLYLRTANDSIRFLGAHFPELKREISTFAESPDGTLWIGTNGGGIIGYREGRICAVFNTANGLASNACRCLYADGYTLWAGSEKGLNKIDITPAKYRVLNTITANDGLNSSIINAVYSDSCFVYVGTPLGLTMFDERNISKGGISFVNMTGITVSGSSLDPQLTDIVLHHHDNNISFEYSGISFLSEGDITYKYRILGLDDQWKTTREAVLTYPSLPSGDYTLELIAINKYGNESKALIRHFKIEKTLSETWGFKLVFALLLVLCIIGVVYLVIQTQHKKATEKLMLQQKINSLEQMALRAQMNPHFIFNCLNSMQDYILDGDIRKANFYLSRFAALVRDTFNNASKMHITLEQEIKYLNAYIDLERMKQSESFDYEIDVDPKIDPQATKIPNMVLQPYIENAIKHGIKQATDRGRLHIAFSLIPEKRLLECVIEDNGPGIEYTKKHGTAKATSLSGSMNITDKRIITLNQLNPESEPIRLQVLDKGHEGRETGTRITIHFPV